MARRERDKHTIRQLYKNSGGSYTLTVPIAHIRDLGWQDKQKVTVKKQGKKLIIEDWEE
jgi:antitoxin component of MazEF toxin-antitoxin module